MRSALRKARNGVVNLA